MLPVKLISICALGLALAGCAKEHADELPGSVETVSARLDSSLVTTVQAILKDKRAEACDQRNGAKMLEIAAALDARAPSLLAFGKNRPTAPNGDWRTEPLGKFFVRKRITPFRTVPGWTTDDPFGWDDIAKQFAKRDSFTEENWYKLNGWVRGILTDDYDRTVGRINYGFDPDLRGSFERLRRAVVDCEAKARCADPARDAELEKFIASQPVYRRLFGLMGEEADLEMRRHWLPTIREWLDTDLGKIAFKPRANVKQTSSGTFEVAMDPGVFAEVAGQLAEFVHAAWSAPGYQVRVNWKSRRQIPDLYQLIMGEEVGERAYVLHSKREMHLFPGFSERTVAHETGHVLGFPDVYFNIWNADTCAYTMKIFSGSIMGDSYDGLVLPEHWAELGKNYPL